ncbi:MAG: AAA family ATPase [Alphaproteobacteria bacterium]|nr:AAA family ATPase [Alphaproteobacteria bacterium]
MEEIEIIIDLEQLQGDLRQKLSRDAAEENALALGWPIAILSRHGAPSVVPVGLVAATWSRNQSHLVLRLSADDVLVNPDWVNSTARSIGWKAADLQQFLQSNDGGGLKLAEFVLRLKEAAASQIRDGLPIRPAAMLNTEIEGLQSAAALFFPTEATFTSGASRDLDRIAAWPESIRNQTALGALFGDQTHEASVPALSVGPLNAEQIEAVRLACTRPLTVVTGPPGTGKSQAITTIAASVLASGGSVLVASKNHQALDAVEDRLRAIAPGANFAVRTLDGANERDRSFRSALDAIVQDVGQITTTAFDLDLEQLNALASRRDDSLLDFLHFRL